MININAPFGFRPARHLGGVLNGRMSTYKLAAGYAVDIMTGDLVKPDGAGHVAKATAITDVMLGVASGVKYIRPDGGIAYSKWWAASTPTKTGTDIEIEVYDDPLVTFYVKTSGTVLYASQLKFVDLVDSPGNSLLGMSMQSVGNPGGAASMFAVMGVVDSIPGIVPNASVPGGIGGFDTGTDGQYATLEVRAVKHILLGAAAGVSA